MNPKGDTRIPEILSRNESNILQDWIKNQASDGAGRSHRMNESELREQSQEFLSALRSASQQGRIDELTGPAWSGVREQLTSISRSRANAGFSSSETARFIFSLKQPLFAALQSEHANDAEALAADTWAATMWLDNLGLWITEAYQKFRDDVISRQQQELLELSTPVVKLWEGILALPLIGTLDSERTQVVMESLLQEVVETGASIAIIDITGVPTVDTLVAQHLLKTIAAARLMGADCIISGIRPQIAATIVHLGVELGDVITKATLADAFRLALVRLGKGVVNLEERHRRTTRGHGTHSDS